MSRTAYPTFVRAIPVRRLGSVNTIWITDALNSGWDGVMMGCKKGDDYPCHFVKGSELAHYRMRNRGEEIRVLPWLLLAAQGLRRQLPDLGQLDVQDAGRQAHRDSRLELLQRLDWLCGRRRTRTTGHACAQLRTLGRAPAGPGYRGHLRRLLAQRARVQGKARRQCATAGRHQPGLERSRADLPGQLAGAPHGGSVDRRLWLR